MANIFGAAGVTPSLRGQPSNVVTLQAGQVMLVPPGAWSIRCGRYSAVEIYDPIAQFWRPVGGDYPTASVAHVQSDGVNWRIANRTGCAVGALITNAGTGYTSAPTVTAVAGGSAWRAIVGGAVSATVTVTNGGTNYTYPPAVLIDAPPQGGIQATGYCTLSGGAVSTVTITDQGAGYASAPAITFRNDPRDSTGANAAATTVLTGAGTVTGLLCTDHGTPQTSLTTLTFSGGGGSSAAATLIACFTATGYTVDIAGSGYSGTVEISGLGGFSASAAIYTNPTTQLNLVRTRKASILGAIASGGISATGQNVYDGGIYPGVPTGIVYGGKAGSGTFTQAGVTITVGGANDVVLMTAA